MTDARTAHLIKVAEFDYPYWLGEARAAVELALETWGFSSLAPKVVIEWNNRFKSRAADANASSCVIRLSTQIWPHMTEQERYETAIHEAAHIANRWRIDSHGRLIMVWSHGSAHGRCWKQLMWRMGIPGERCHHINTFKLGISKRRGKKERYHGKCGCPTDVKVGPTIAKRMITGTHSYICRKCRCSIKRSTLRKVEI